MLTRHAHNRRSRNRLLRGRSARRGGGGAPLTLRQQIGAVLGVEPQVFADARDLDLDDTDPVSTFGDWTMLNGSFGPATYDADGWGGSLPLVNMNGDRGSSDDVSNYEHTTPAIWTFTGVRVGAGTAVETIHLEGSAPAYRRFNFNTNQSRLQHLIRNDAGTSEADFGTAFDTTKPMHAGVVYDGSTVSVAVLNSDGLAVVINNAPVDTTGPSTYSDLFLGNAGTDTLNVGITTLTRCSAGSATQANLQAVLNLHNQAYPVA